MHADLHSVDFNSVRVNNFEAGKDSRGFASVSVSDDSGNSVALYFSNPAEVLALALIIEDRVKAVLAN